MRQVPAAQPPADGFDLMVTHRDPHTGLITHKNPYAMRVVASADGGKTRIFERPKGSGNLFDKKNVACGRWVNGKWDKEAKHEAWNPPQTKDQMIAQENAALKAEVAALKAEQLKKTAAPQKKDQGS